MSIGGTYLWWLGAKFIPEQTREKNRLYVLIDHLKRPPPIVYDEYDPGDGEKVQKVPYGKMEHYWLLKLKDRTITGRVNAANEILTDETNKHKFQLVLDTDQGVFVRNIGQDDVNELKVCDDNFELKMKWPPVHFGQDVYVHRSMIVYREQIMDYANFQCVQMTSENVLRVDFTFRN
jgi:hypothetical protein